MALLSDSVISQNQILLFALDTSGNSVGVSGAYVFTPPAGTAYGTVAISSATIPETGVGTVLITVVKSGIIPQFIIPEALGILMLSACGLVLFGYVLASYGFSAALPIVGTLIGGLIALISLVVLARRVR